MTNEYNFMAYCGECITVEANPGERYRTAVLTGQVIAENEAQALEGISRLIINPKLSDLEILAVLYPILDGPQFYGKPLVEWKNKKLYHKGREVSEAHELNRFFVK